MATLVLSTVGTAIGGPIGAAIGAVVGGVIDRNVVFKPKGRTGPRLAELKVQTSSYGVPIPRLHGRMRVAGTVIWATDLKEQKSSQSSGKGVPKVTSFTYSASFAVALSSRRILRVERIWADGNLLRGAAGDFKTQARFRLYNGDPDQAVDPLIAADKGIATCPAFRGLGYAVFEAMDLTAYGNRIPSLTFEVVADETPPSIGAIIADALPAAMTVECTTLIDGYAIEGDTAGAAIAPLVELTDLTLQPRNGETVLARTGGVLAIAAREVSSEDRIVVSRVPLDAVPSEITVRHYVPERDYQPGAQSVMTPRSARGGARRAAEIDVPATIGAQAARGFATQLMRRAASERSTATVPVTLAHLATPLGAVVTTPGLAGQWRVTEIGVKGAGANRIAATLRLTGIDDGAIAPAAPGASSGAPVREPDLPVPPTTWRLISLPFVEGVSLGGRFVAAGGTAPGWRGATALAKAGPDSDEIVLARVGLESAIGSAVAELAPGSAALFDRANSIDVELEHAGMTLTGATDGQLLAGANLALIGRELIQYGNADQLSPTRYRLSRLLRGRLGGEDAVNGHAAGDHFVAIDASALLAVPNTGIAELSLRGTGDLSVSWDAVPPVAPALPLAPVHLRGRFTGEGGLTLSWTRRNRTGFAWVDSVDAPLGEEIERYRVTLVRSGVQTVTEASGAEASFAAADLPGSAGSPLQVSVEQVGTYGVSLACVITLSSSS